MSLINSINKQCSLKRYSRGLIHHRQVPRNTPHEMARTPYVWTQPLKVVSEFGSVSYRIPVEGTVDYATHSMFRKKTSSSTPLTVLNYSWSPDYRL